MSRSLSSTNSTVTAVPVEWVEVMSLVPEQPVEEGSEQEETRVMTLVYQEELDILLRRIVECLDINMELMESLAGFIRMLKE